MILSVIPSVQSVLQIKPTQEMCEFIVGRLTPSSSLPENVHRIFVNYQSQLEADEMPTYTMNDVGKNHTVLAFIVIALGRELEIDIPDWVLSYEGEPDKSFETDYMLTFDDILWIRKRMVELGIHYPSIDYLLQRSEILPAGEEYLSGMQTYLFVQICYYRCLSMLENYIGN